MKRRLSVQVYYENRMLEAQLYEFITAAFNYSEQSTACFSQLLCLPYSIARTLGGPHHHYERGDEKTHHPACNRSSTVQIQVSRSTDGTFKPAG